MTVPLLRRIIPSLNGWFGCEPRRALRHRSARSIGNPFIARSPQNIVVTMGSKSGAALSPDVRRNALRRMEILNYREPRYLPSIGGRKTRRMGLWWRIHNRQFLFAGVGQTRMTAKQKKKIRYWSFCIFFSILFFFFFFFKSALWELISQVRFSIISNKKSSLIFAPHTTTRCTFESLNTLQDHLFLGGQGGGEI